MAFQLDSKTTALVLIDLQRGIVALPVQPRSSKEVVDASRGLAATSRARGVPVIYVRVDLSDMTPLLTDASHTRGDVPAIASELVPEAGFQDGDVVVTKRHWGAFGSAELEPLLRERGIDTIVLAGIATNFGVESTARQATSLGFNVVIAEDACTSLDAAAHAFAMEKILPGITRVRTVQEITAALT